ncbi:LLM class flavin-dependent oxidoreductase [Paenibacillus thailandensis]|uniref:LLM class flavin-dependent oxidoreductase n=1 Tax=Paenibacillus thailandensis TaxID=393250 RepID=A0ABW5QVD7_9BACL
MKFIWFSLVMNLTNPVTGESFTTGEKFENIIRQALLAEKLGYEGYGVGERHGAPFLSSSPPLLLTAIAARTSRIRLFTAVTVLSVLDPVRVALANTTEEAIRRYRPYYEAFQSTAAAKHNQSPFTSLEDHIENGPILVGSPEQVIEKILNYQAAFGHQVLSLSVDGLSEAEQREQMERFASEVAPVLRKEAPSELWQKSCSISKTV